MLSSMSFPENAHRLNKTRIIMRFIYYHQYKNIFLLELDVALAR
jgi:hypothetical protein